MCDVRSVFFLCELLRRGGWQRTAAGGHALVPLLTGRCSSSISPPCMLSPAHIRCHSLTLSLTHNSYRCMQVVHLACSWPDSPGRVTQAPATLHAFGMHMAETMICDLILNTNVASPVHTCAYPLTPLACGPGSPEVPQSVSAMASNLCTLLCPFTCVWKTPTRVCCACMRASCYICAVTYVQPAIFHAPRALQQLGYVACASRN